MPRVHGRKMRQIDVNNRLHRIGNKNTTGAFGDTSTWNVRVSHSRKLDPGADGEVAGRITVETGLPGKRRAAKRKRTSKMFPGKSQVIFDRANRKQLYNLRADMLTASIMGGLLNQIILPEHAVNSLREISTYLRKVQTASENLAMDSADRARFYSIQGMHNKGQLTKGKPISCLWARIERAMFQIREKIERKAMPYDFKPEPTVRFVL